MRQLGFPAYTTSAGWIGYSDDKLRQLSASLEDRILEHVDHLHEHFVDPVVVQAGRYMPPTAPGYSTTLRPESLDQFEFPTGAAWAR